MQAAKDDNARLVKSLKSALPLLPLAQQQSLVAACPAELADVTLPPPASIAPPPHACAPAPCSSERCTPLSSLSAPSVAHFSQQPASDTLGNSACDATSVAAGGAPRVWEVHNGLEATSREGSGTLDEVSSATTLPQVVSLGVGVGEPACETPVKPTQYASLANSASCLCSCQPSEHARSEGAHAYSLSTRSAGTYLRRAPSASARSRALAPRLTPPVAIWASGPCPTSSPPRRPVARRTCSRRRSRRC